MLFFYCPVRNFALSRAGWYSFRLLCGWISRSLFVILQKTVLEHRVVLPVLALMFYLSFAKHQSLRPAYLYYSLVFCSLLVTVGNLEAHGKALLYSLDAIHIRLLNAVKIWGLRCHRIDTLQLDCPRPITRRLTLPEAE